MRDVRSLVATVVVFVVPAVVPGGWPRGPWSWATSTYAHIGRLPNAENDATDMSAALRRTNPGVPVERAGGSASSDSPRKRPLEGDRGSTTGR